MILPRSLVFLHRVAWLILECARRMSTFISCAFREQEDDQAAHPILPRSLVIPSGMGAGLSGFFGFPISQPNERDKPNKPDKRDRPVSALPTAAAFGLKDADPAAESLHVISWLLDTSVLHRNSQIGRKRKHSTFPSVSAGVRSVEGSLGVPRVTGCCRGLTNSTA